MCIYTSQDPPISIGDDRTGIRTKREQVRKDRSRNLIHKFEQEIRSRNSIASFDRACLQYRTILCSAMQYCAMSCKIMPYCTAVCVTVCRVAQRCATVCNTGQYYAAWCNIVQKSIPKRSWEKL